MSSYVDPTAGPVEHCEQAAQTHPDLAAAYQGMAADCSHKLWHQFSVKVLDFLYDRLNVRDDNNFVTLYDQVVTPVASKIQPLRLAEMAAAVAYTSADPTASKALLENLLLANQTETEHLKAAREADQDRTTPATLAADQAHTLVRIYLQAKLRGLSSTDTNKTALLSQLRTNGQVLDRMLVVPSQQSDYTLVCTAHYEQACLLYKAIGPPEAFYEQARLLLQSAPPSSTQTRALSSLTYPQLAVDWCLAALTGEGVYDLGQILAHEDLLALLGPEHVWLGDLVQTCADGNVRQLDALTQQHAAALAQQPALLHRASLVREKVTLLGLINMIGQRQAHDRTLDFAEIAAALHMDVNQVELVVMRALSVHLMEGSLDQVDQQVSVTWVRPRVLNAAQTEALAARFGEWATKVQTTKASMKEFTPVLA